MDQEKFVGTYIELLNTTISEAIQKNIVAQAQKKVLEKEKEELVQQWEKSVLEMREKMQLRDKEIAELKKELNNERQQAGTLRVNMHEASVAKQHFETYKNELSASRQENEELKKLIAEKDAELLKLQPKPVPVVINKLGKKTVNASSEQKVVKVKTVKDAGSF